MKKIFLQVLLIGGTLGYGVLVFAHSTGINGATRKNGNGCTCHVGSQGQSGPSPSVIVTISGLDTLTVGQTTEYQLAIQGGPAIAAGTNIAASAGILDTALFNVPRLFAFDGELTHETPAPFGGATATFRFRYTAPQTAGTVTLFGNGNSVNKNGTSFGDEWNFAPDKLVVIRPSVTALERGDPVAPTFLLEQNYPNPFNPATNIRFHLAEPARVRLTVHDLLGKEVARLLERDLEAGAYQSFFEGCGLPCGTYCYRLTAGSSSETKRMILTR